MKTINQGLHDCFADNSLITPFIDHCIAIATQTLSDSRFLLHISGKFRRFWLVHFQKQYVHDQLCIRQGDCRQCGLCCNLLFTCPSLTKQGRCMVYGSCRPLSCKVFPIDQRDIDEVGLCGGHCGYRFESQAT